jgi:hypothetical protein
VVLLSAFAFSTAGLFTRLVETDVWTMLFWRGLFGGLLIAGYVVWRDGPLAMAALRRIGRPGLVAAGCSTAATICFINALRETSVADVLVINATAPFITAAMAWAWTGARERRATLWPAAWRCWASSSWSCRRWAPATAGQRAGVRHDRPDLGHDGGDAPSPRCLHAARGRAVGLPVRPRRVAVGIARCGDGRRLRLAGPVRHDAVRPRPAPAHLGLRSVSATRSALIGALETPLAPAIVWWCLGEVPAAHDLRRRRHRARGRVRRSCWRQGRNSPWALRQRVKELGLALPPPPKSAGNYVAGVQSGNLLFLSGCGPQRADGSYVLGKLGADLDVAAGL